MTSSIGFIGPSSAAGLANAAIDQADTAVGAAEVQAEHAADLRAMMKPQPSRAERQRDAEAPAVSADDGATEPGDDTLSSSGGPALDMAPLASSLAGLVERGVHAPMHRMPGDGAPIRRIDRRRKRSC